MLECNETITLVHQLKDDDDTLECHTVKNCSWFEKLTITTSADGAKPVNTFEVRIFDALNGIIIARGDYCVKGIVTNIEKPSDLKNETYFRITAIGNNMRGGLAHWRVSGQ